MSTTTTTTTIKSLPFGDKGAIARTLTTKGAEKSAQIIVNAILPMLSNIAIGHKTFSPVFAKSYKGNCPLCVAVSALKGKAGLARDAAFADIKKANSQADHDAMIEQAELTILSVFAPVVREKSERTDWKALAERLQAQLQACQIDLAESQEKVAQLMAQANTPAPAPAPAPSMA